MNNTINEIQYLSVDDIIPNRFQPREVFDETALQELSLSIKEHGVIQPIIVRQIDNKYEIIAGERRYKASIMAGLTSIPAIIKNLDDKESSKVALLENLQRKDLNAIEEARTYQNILKLDNMTQEQLAKSLGISQPLIANKIRLLSLPYEVQDAILKEQISERHARSLLNVKDDKAQIELLQRIKNERLTVRELDQIIKNDGKPMNTNNSLGKMLEGESLTDNQTVNLESNENIISQNRYQATEKPLQNYLQREETFSSTNETNIPTSNILENTKQNDFLDLNAVDNNLNALNSLLKTKTVEVNESSPIEELNTIPQKRTIKNAIDLVKNTIDELEKNKYQITTEEIDYDDNYQIIIKVNKNNLDER